MGLIELRSLIARRRFCYPKGGEMLTKTQGLTDLLTVGQVSRQLGVSHTMLRKHVRRGQIEAIESPYGNLFEAEEIERFQRERVTRTATPRERVGV